MKVLELSRKKVEFLREPLLLDSNDEIYITNNKAIKKEIKNLYSQRQTN